MMGYSRNQREKYLQRSLPSSEGWQLSTQAITPRKKLSIKVEGEIKRKHFIIKTD